MKKLLSILLSAIMFLSFFGCSSREERELREAQEAAERASDAYKDAVDSYNNTKEMINDYNAAVNKLYR